MRELTECRTSGEERDVGVEGFEFGILQQFVRRRREGSQGCPVSIVRRCVYSGLDQLCLDLLSRLKTHDKSYHNMTNPRNVVPIPQDQLEIIHGVKSA